MTKFLKGYTKPRLDKDANMIFEKVVDDNGTIKEFTPESQGYVKKLDITIIFTRQGYDERNLILVTGYFRQPLTISIPEQNNTRYTYLFHDARTMNTVCLRNFAGDYTYTVSLRKPKQGEERLYDILYGEPERITEQEARDLMLKRQALALFDSEALTDNCISKVRLQVGHVAMANNLTVSPHEPQEGFSLVSTSCEVVDHGNLTFEKPVQDATATKEF